MNNIIVISRWLLAIIFIAVSAIRLFLPSRVAEFNQFQGKSLVFFNAIKDTGYLYYSLIGFEILISVLLIANRYLNFGLILFAPLMINILLFHVFLDPRPSRLVFIGIMTICYGILCYNYIDFTMHKL